MVRSCTNAHVCVCVCVSVLEFRHGQVCAYVTLSRRSSRYHVEYANTCSLVCFLLSERTRNSCFGVFMPTFTWIFICRLVYHVICLWQDVFDMIECPAHFTSCVRECEHIHATCMPQLATMYTCMPAHCCSAFWKFCLC